MTLLRLEQLQLAYGPQVLLDGADLVVERGERLALVGRNGTGKSTLLGLVAGDNQPDDGVVWRAPGLRIGVLEQDLPAASGMTIFDVVAQGLPQAGALLAEWLATGQGIGYQIVSDVSRARYESVWASVVVVTAASLLLYGIVSVLERLVLRRMGQTV